MRVLLILKDSMAYERMAILCLGAALKEAGHEVRFWIAAANEKEQLHHYMREFQPGIVGYSCMTGEHILLCELNRELKQRYEFHATLGGAHAILFHEAIEEIGIDSICVGEADLAFPEFCRRMERGEDYWNTPTFHVKHEGEVIRNPLWRLTPMEELAYPDRALYYEADPELARMGTKNFQSSRGCVYKCTYCFIVKYNEFYRGNGKVVRCRTPEQVVREIEWTRERYTLTHVNFTDDMFTLKPPQWFREFHQLYRERVDLPWSCSLRPNTVNDEVIALLRDCGLMWVWMGVECGDEKIANEVLRRELSNAQLEHAATVLHRNGVGFITQNLIGLPVEDPIATDLETLDLNIKLRPTMGWSSILYPYPGTPIERYARQSGHLTGTPELMETNKRSTVLEFESHKVKRTIENLHKLFPIVVRFPFLRPYVEKLARLPLGFVYRPLWYLFYGWVFKIKLTKLRRSELPYFVKLFFRMLYKS